jgi:hypothetical protein
MPPSLLDLTDVLLAPPGLDDSTPPPLNALDLARLACVSRALRPLAAAALQRRSCAEVALDCLLARDLPRLQARVARALDRARARAPTPLHPLPHFLASIRYFPLGDASLHLVYSTQRHGHAAAAAAQPCIDLWNPAARACDVLHPTPQDPDALRRHPFLQTPDVRTQTHRVRVRLLFLPADLFDDDDGADDGYPFQYPRTHLHALYYDDDRRNWMRP